MRESVVTKNHMPLQKVYLVKFKHTPFPTLLSLTSLTSLFILQPEDHRPMWYIHTITGEHRY